MVVNKLDDQAIFEVARKISSREARQAYLTQICGADLAIVERIDALLRAHDKSSNFLECPPPGISTSPTIDPPAQEKPGTQIGPYKLLQQIGEGGMGTVYMAEQAEPVQRKVALKLIKPGMGSRQVIARFEAERQALAMMDHVNIARVLDAGATGPTSGYPGRPYFVMELVHGVPITKYCDDNRLSPRQRLELFVPVCQAIQHAHQKGIIHRDIKPSNVMVTLYDGKPVPKVIDFGVAKATEQKLTERTLFTQYGTMVGTLEYMSPEQAEMSALGVDTRSDIYSLGVLLYELLTGSTPLSSKRMKEAAYAEILRLIKEEEPPKPSTRLSDSGEALASISAQRHMEPAKLSKLMRGELDWIVMKTLEKDRSRRYETANGFAADVQRYLNDESVLACPPSAAYRFRKFARRNRVAITTAAIVSVALVLGTFVSAWQAIRATRAEGLADERLKTANANYDTAKAQRQRAEASGAESKTKEGLAQDARKEAVESLKDAVAAVDQMLTRVGEDRLANVPQMEPVRRELLQDALKFYQRFLLKNSDDPMIRRETAMAYRRLAEIHRILGQYAEAVTDYRKTFVLFDELQAQSLLEPNTRRDLSLAHLEISTCFRDLGKPEEQEKHTQRAVVIAEELTKEFPQDLNHRDQLALAKYYLAVLISPTRPEEAEKILRRNLTLTNNTGHLVEYHRSLGNLLASQGRSSEAEQSVRQALVFCEEFASENPSSNWAQEALGATLHQLSQFVADAGRLQEAEALSGRAITILDKLATDYPAGPNYRNSQAWAHHRHAQLLRKLNRNTEAEQAYRRAVDLFVKLAADFPSIHAYPQTVFDQRLNLGQFLLEAGRAEDALDVYRQAADFPGKLAGDVPATLNHWHGLVRSHGELGRLLTQGGKTAEAETAFRRALEIQEKLEKLAADSPGQPSYLADIGWTCRKLASILVRQPNHGSEAETMHRRDIDVFEKLSAEFPDNAAWPEQLAHGHRQWGFDRWETGLAKEGDKSLREAINVLGKSAADFPNAVPSHRALLIDTYRRLVGFLATTGEAQESEQAILEILKALEKHVTDYPNEHAYRRVVAVAHNALGSMFKTQHRISEAEQAYDRARVVLQKLTADFPTVTLYWDDLILSHCKLGDTLQTAGRHQEAQTAYTRASGLNPTAPAAWFKRAAAFGALGQWEQAAADMSKVVELDPKSAVAHNNLAWLLATCPEAKLRDPTRAVELAKKALELAPNETTFWNTLGVAHYRAEHWSAAITALTKSMEIRAGGDSFDWFFLAMAHCQLDKKDEARDWFNQAVEWMEKKKPQDEELQRFRAEAADLLGF